jgi:hypothetical protein
VYIYLYTYIQIPVDVGGGIDVLVGYVGEDDPFLEVKADNSNDDDETAEGDLFVFVELIRATAEISLSVRNSSWTLSWNIKKKNQIGIVVITIIQ